jgi:hypothetical protein
MAANVIGGLITLTGPGNGAVPARTMKAARSRTSVTCTGWPGRAAQGTGPSPAGGGDLARQEPAEVGHGVPRAGVQGGQPVRGGAVADQPGNAREQVGSGLSTMEQGDVVALGQSVLGQVTAEVLGPAQDEQTHGGAPGNGRRESMSSGIMPG